MEVELQNLLTWQICLLLVLETVAAVKADDAATARRQALMHSYGTYGGNLRTPDGHIDGVRLLADLNELHANTYNWLIGNAATDWGDLHTFLPLAQKHGIHVWVTLLPPSESPSRTKHFSEPFRLDFEKWAAELAALSAREPALVAWSIDDFAYNLKDFTPDRIRAIIAAQREKNHKFAFAPCVYYKNDTVAFANNY